ncbi:hypothetical protein LWI29_035563 [Acer saccharum]|uniref:RNase H type-1 domain-containing protein n=1 Tax=Acer saccharum TaxID=4024 RepID=A0AA39S744_ACESA|nr:hypothetical protein LWI29_035563 [Acer saccharum]
MVPEKEILEKLVQEWLCTTKMEMWYIRRVSEGLGKATSNETEYRALTRGQKCALDDGFEGVRVQGDSKLVRKQPPTQTHSANQVNGPCLDGCAHNNTVIAPLLFLGFSAHKPWTRSLEHFLLQDDFIA